LLAQHGSRFAAAAVQNWSGITTTLFLIPDGSTERKAGAKIGMQYGKLINSATNFLT